MAGQRNDVERTQFALQTICAARGARGGYLYLLTPAGPMLRASHGGSVPSAEIAERVSDYVAEKQRHAGALDDMATGALEDGEAPLVSAPQIEGSSHELLPLSCVVEVTSVLVGVAVVEAPRGLSRGVQSELLHVLASSLLQAGDSLGVRLQ
jgi:hypothetical protein